MLDNNKFSPELQSEIPAQGGKYDTNRIKYKGESDDTRAGGTEKFFLFLCGSRTAGGERSELFDKTEGYEEWLSSVTLNTNPKTVNENWVVTDTFFAIRKSDDKIIGIIDLRHTLNEFLKDLGNCGYSVRPSERKKGYATEMLYQLLQAAKEAEMKELHISVEKENAASIKVIQKNGGVYEPMSFR